MNTNAKLAMLSLVALMTACQSNDAPVVNVESEGSQTIVLTVSDAKSRAGRDLESTEAAQAIENVKVILVDDAGKVVWTKLCDKWCTEDAVVCENGREATIEIPKNEYRMLSGKVYHLYGIGYSNGSDYDLSYYTNIKANDMFSIDTPIKLEDNGAKAEEIFAGDCTVEGNVAGVRMSIVLNRQVAGTFGYLTKIPYVKDRAGHVGSYIMLVASNPQSQMLLGMFDNANSSETYDGKYVINGLANSETHVVYTINLKNWFNAIEEKIDEDGYHTGTIKVEDNWKGDKSRYRKGSVFAGSFIIPFLKTDDVTFKLLLCYNNDINTALREWNVLLPANAAQLSPYNMWKAGDNGWTSMNMTDNNAVYSVLRNHLYGIGTKNSTILPGFNPERPDDPIPDDENDNPEPINNKQDLMITVNHNWDTIYNMGVE